MVEVLKKYPWYLPAHIAAWRANQGEGADALTELVVMNHPEAVVDPEEVDMEFLMSFVSEPIPSAPPVLDAIASLSMMQSSTAEVKPSRSRGLIDKFLEVKELRITPPQEEETEVADLMWERSDPNEPYTPNDDLASEELARIYINQKLYKEASVIYNRLFLLYSEKSVYFATQIEKIDEILANSTEKGLK